MKSVEHATPFILCALIVALGVTLLSIYRARKGKHIFVRRLAGIDALYEAIGSSAELGRPVSFSTGLSSVGPVLYAAIGVLYAIARKCARYGTALFIPQNDPPAMALVEEITRDAYRDEGKPAQYDPRKVLFLSEEQFAFASGYMGMMHREKVGAAFLFGAFAGESLILAEAGQQVGAMQVAASVSPEQVAFFIATCDYTLIGEELFAASAYLSDEPIQRGSVRAQDLIKTAVFWIIVCGVILSSVSQFIPEVSAQLLENIFYLSWESL